MIAFEWSKAIINYFLVPIVPTLKPLASPGIANLRNSWHIVDAHHMYPIPIYPYCSFISLGYVSSA